MSSLKPLLLLFIRSSVAQHQLIEIHLVPIFCFLFFAFQNFTALAYKHFTSKKSIKHRRSSAYFYFVLTHSFNIGSSFIYPGLSPHCARTGNRPGTVHCVSGIRVKRIWLVLLAEKTNKKKNCVWRNSVMVKQVHEEAHHGNECINRMPTEGCTPLPKLPIFGLCSELRGCSSLT